MIGAPDAYQTRPVEEELHRVASTVAAAANAAGYVYAYQINHSQSPHNDERIFLITFKLKKDGNETLANIQLRASSFGLPRVHSTQGFPPEFGPCLLDISPPTYLQGNTKGVQAVPQDDSAAQIGRGTVEARPDPQAKSKQEVADMVVASIDVATLRDFLKNPERTRRYIGASGIAEKCEAAMQLSLRGFPGDAPSPQLIRIFGEGHRIEAHVVAALRAAGHEVRDVDPTTGEQWEYTSHGGHHVCHLDGFIKLAGGDKRMVLEIKSMNRKMFDKFKKVGVKRSHPEYYAQIQDQMDLVRTDAGETLDAFFVAYCKDNSQYHAEIVPIDMAASVATGVILSKQMSGRAKRSGSHKNEYDCTQCFKRTSCWEPDLSKDGANCWHCEHATPMTKGGDGKPWQCLVNGKTGVVNICPTFKMWRPEKK